MVAVLYLVAILLCYNMMQFDAKCISDDYVDGCSVPLKSVFFPYAYYFEKACDKHDVCYDCVSEASIILNQINLQLGNQCTIQTKFNNITC